MTSTTTAFLRGVTAASAVIAATVFLTGAKGPAPSFEEINVGRINVREPDGTLRMVIANKAQFPGAFQQGQEIARPDRRDFAGMIFVNDEGTENGGFIQKGVLGADGKVKAGLSLTFDRFRQDQTLQLLQAEEGEFSSASLIINDQPSGLRHPVGRDTALEEAMRKLDTLPPAERQAQVARMREEGRLMSNRIRLGTTGSRAAAMSLSDAQGRPRLMFMVSAKGEPTMTVLDEQGRPVRQVRLDQELPLPAAGKP